MVENKQKFRIQLGVAVVAMAAIAALLGYTMLTGDSASGHAGMPGMSDMEDSTEMSGMPGMAGMAELHGDGLSDSHNGFRLVTEELPSKVGEQRPVSFQILGKQGEPVTDYRVNMTKRLHMIVVRDDLSAFQHVHPELDGDTWRTEIEIPDGGQYRMFAEFVPQRGQDEPHPVLLGKPFIVAGDTALMPLPEPADEVKAGEYAVTRPDGAAQPTVKELTTLRFKVTTADGQPADLETYLDSYAHVTAFNARSLAATHMHPMQKPGEALPDDELRVQAVFPQRGEQRVFVEFKVDGKVHTAAFTLFVT